MIEPFRVDSPPASSRNEIFRVRYISSAPEYTPSRANLSPACVRRDLPPAFFLRRHPRAAGRPMALDHERAEGDHKKLWSHLKMPFWQSIASSPSPGTSSSASAPSFQQNQSVHPIHHQLGDHHSASGVAAMAKSLLPARRRLRLDPPNKLFFPYEPGKQVRSAIEIKNVSKTHVAFKFQTTAPKSCYMRPPGSVLAPGENLIATVFKFVEPPENDDKPANLKSIVKFKIMSLKVNGQMEYLPELFDEQRDQVTVEKILRVVFLDPEQPSHLLEKLKRQVAEAEAALETRKKPVEEPGAGPVKEGLVIDEWKERRERYLAQQHLEGVDTIKMDQF